MAGPDAQARPAHAWLRCLGFSAALAPAPASAGAWIAAEGGQEIWTSVAGERAGLSFFESSGYLEAPLDEDTSIVIAPWVEQNYDSEDGWRGEATLGLKRKVYDTETGVVAVQASALWLSYPTPDCSEGGAELRLLAGRNIGETGFVNAEIAGRALEGGCGGERLDLTIGYRPADNWLGIAQVFADSTRGGEEAVRGQVSFVRFGERGRGIQFGLRARLDGGPAEPALVVGVWSSLNPRRA